MGPKIPTIKLNSGYEIPVFGLGTWKSKPGEVEEAVKNAIDVGYRHIDGARAYLNESEVGAAVQAKIAEGVVKREDLFITSKLWNTFHSPDLVLPSLKQTLSDLGTSYLDLYLIHWPMGYKEGGEFFPKDDDGKFLYSDVDYVDTWKVLEEAVDQGLVRSIGVSNFNSQQISRVLAIAKIPPALNQVETHPYLNQEKLIAFCKKNNIAVTGYSPLGIHPIGCADRPWAKPDDPKLLDDPRLVELGKKYNKSSAQIVLRWATQRGVITIPKTVNKNRLIENMDIFDFTLSDEDIQSINSIDCNGRICHLDWVNDHPHHPFPVTE